MAHLAIWFVLAIIATFSNQKESEKLNFEWSFCTSCRVAFCLVLQFTANVLGSRKSAVIHSNRPLVFAPMVFLFLLCILVQMLYSEENHRYHKPITTSHYLR